jgi:DNA-binding IclR family transcriptional regulator
VLESLVESGSPRGITELSRDIEMDKSAVQRVFQTLADAGYIVKNGDTSRYQPTLKLWELGSAVIAQNEHRRLIHPILRFMSHVSGLTAYLAWADFPDIIYLDKSEGERGRSNSSDPGQRVPMYLTASGRAVLAFSDETLLEAELKRLSSMRPLPPEFDADVLRNELIATRDRMYAISERMATSRINSIAAPIWNSEGAPCGSMVLTSDATTFPPSDFSRIGAIVLNAAEQATRVLGGVFPQVGVEAP